MEGRKQVLEDFEFWQVQGLDEFKNTGGTLERESLKHAALLFKLSEKQV